MISHSTEHSANRIHHLSALRFPFLSVILLLLLLVPVPGKADDPCALTPVDAARVHEMVTQSGAKLTLVNYWSTWCVPCREEMPALSQLQRKYARDGLRVIFVSMDFESNKVSALDTLLAKGGRLPSYIKGQKDDPFISGIHSEWSGAIPATFLYDAEGTLLTWWNEAQTFSEFEQDILPYLKNK